MSLLLLKQYWHCIFRMPLRLPLLCPNLEIDREIGKSTFRNWVQSTKRKSALPGRPGPSLGLVEKLTNKEEKFSLRSRQSSWHVLGVSRIHYKSLIRKPWGYGKTIWGEVV
ncbi:hypothetical protein CDAR_369941 [Caerostris darwini]|uniref:Uncharacterized protein n=1 Tax=Caerostris darwini TaxID=1538125 RepID=A0AAV4Q1Z4_9ARAC|nr:hypothetical protein CDAR_369941 [Caerostris darwini]